MSTEKEQLITEEDEQWDETELSEDLVVSDAVSAEQLIEWIKSRRTIGNLQEHAPTHEQIRAANGCAATAPDHKKLRPWRFIVTEGEARKQLGQALLAAAIAQAEKEGEELSEETRYKTANLPLRAPMIVTVVTKIQEHKRVIVTTLKIEFVYSPVLDFAKNIGKNEAEVVSADVKRGIFNSFAL